jgi:phosphate transport system substrate-binding protein
VVGRKQGLAAAVLGLFLAAACGGSGPASSGAGGGTLRVNGSTTVNPVAADAAEALRKQGLKITVDASGGSAGGISDLAAGRAEIAMSSKPIAAEDRAAAPGVEFRSTQIGADAVGIIVSRAIYDGGVKNLTKAQVRSLFEGKVKSWKELGGPDVEVFVYDKEPGRGTREVIDKYLYGNDKAPPPPQSNNFAIVGGNEEGRAKVLSTPGGVTPLSTSFITGYPKLAAVSIDGVEPTAAHIVDQSYAMSRPLFLVTNGPPAGAIKTFVDYVVGDAGQELVHKAGYLNLADLGQRR